MKKLDLRVGRELPALKINPITRKTLALFAGSSGDHQPSHIDIDAAREKGRDDVIAHGMLTMAYMSRLLTEYFPQSSIRAFSTRFLRFTPVRASPTIRAEVTGLSGTDASITLTAILEDGTVVAKGEATIDRAIAYDGPE